MMQIFQVTLRAVTKMNPTGRSNCLLKVQPTGFQVHNPIPTAYWGPTPIGANAVNSAGNVATHK